jgi:predicted transcriptional regulator
MAKKLTVQFNESTDELLTKMAERRGLTKTDILRRAIALYDYVDKQTTDTAKRLTISSEDGKVLTDIVTT